MLQGNRGEGSMRKILLLSAVIFLSFSLFSQQITEETFVVNVEVPVRVFKGNTFVDVLTIDDFEVFEDGIPQKIEAVYLVKKRSIERREEKKRFSPQTSRNFYLFFEITEYDPKLGRALNYFVQNVAAPDDNINIVTPMKTYRLKSRSFEILSKEEVVNQLKGILRKDALVGSSEYRDTVEDIMLLAKSLSSTVQLRNTSRTDAQESLSTIEFGQVATVTLDRFNPSEYESMPLDEQLTRYADLLNKLEYLRFVDQQKFLEFANLLKNKEGQKYVFLFYQREFIPRVEPKILNEYISLYQDRPDILQTVSGLFDFYRRDVSIDVNRVKQAFADSSISIHFLFITTPPKHIPGVVMEEHSEDIFSAFRDMAEATGGFSESSANSASLFQKALEASENYFLIYYSPENYRRDGKFREIKVRVKDKDCRVIHRLGYFAN